MFYLTFPKIYEGIKAVLSVFEIFYTVKNISNEVKEMKEIIKFRENTKYEFTSIFKSDIDTIILQKSETILIDEIKKLYENHENFSKTLLDKLSDNNKLIFLEFLDFYTNSHLSHPEYELKINEYVNKF